MSLTDAKAAAVIHWPCDEASGNILDALTGNDATETSGTIASAAGKFGNARDFEAGDTEYASAADSADTSIGDILWFATLWVNPETLSVFPMIFRKGDSGAAAREVALFVNTDAGNIVTFQAGDGAATSQVSTPGAITTAGWHLLCVRHNPTANTIGISIDGAAFTDAAHSTGIQNGTAAFEIGASSEQAIYWDGLIDDIVIGKSYLFTDGDASDLWNSGTGVAFEDWDTVPAPGQFHGSVNASGDAEVAWTPISGATSYHVYREGVEIAEVDSTDPPRYVDTGYTSGDEYTLTSDNGTESDPTDAFEPTPYRTTDVSSVVSHANERTNLLYDGADYLLAVAENLTYTALSNAAFDRDSRLRLFTETFTGGAPLSAVTTGSITAIGSGSATTAVTTTLRYASRPPAPNFSVVLTCDWADDVWLGFGLDSTHGIYVRFDESAGTLDVFGINGAGESELLAAAAHALTTGDKLKIEFVNDNVQVWKDVGAGWVHVFSESFQTAETDYDLRFATEMTTWLPIVRCIGITVLTEFYCGGYDGSGRGREIAPVTYKDGTPVQFENGNYLVGIDRTGPVAPSLAAQNGGLGGNITTAVSFALHEYDADTGEFVGGSIAVISMETTGGALISTSDTKCVWEPGVGLHVWANDWTEWNDAETFPNETSVYYQLYTGEIEGFIHLDSAAKISVPVAITQNKWYGVDVFQLNDTWYMCGTHLDVMSGSLPVAFVLSGPDPDDMDTAVDSEPSGSFRVEGKSWMFLGSRIYMIGGLWEGGFGLAGSIVYWGFTNLTSLGTPAYLDYPIPGGSMALAQQPSMLSVYRDGQTVPQLLGFDDVNFTTNYDMGPLCVFEPDFGNLGYQFPVRTAFDAEEEASGSFGVFESSIFMGAS